MELKSIQLSSLSLFVPRVVCYAARYLQGQDQFNSLLFIAEFKQNLLLGLDIFLVVSIAKNQFSACWKEKLIAAFPKPQLRENLLLGLDSYLVVSIAKK